MKVAEWIINSPGKFPTVRPQCSLDEVADRLLEEANLRDLYVTTTDGHVLGHLGYNRIAHLLLAEHRRTHTRREIVERVAAGTAKQLMNTHFACAHLDEDLENVLHRQLGTNVEDMAIVDDNGILVGTVNLRSVLVEIRKSADGTL